MTLPARPLHPGEIFQFHPAAAERAELLAGGVPEQVVASLYPQDIAALIESLKVYLAQGGNIDDWLALVK